MTILFLALRNIILQWKRYILMFTAILLGFSLMMLVNSIANGALSTVREKAARYFSGNISVTGYIKTNRGQSMENASEVEKLLYQSDLSYSNITARTIYYKKDAALFFGGESINQRRLIGLDFEEEESIFSTLDFREGSFDAILENKEDGILISEAAANLLGARVGDDIQLSLTTDTGQYNSATLYIRGIFRETGLFGYVAYMNRTDLNRLLIRDDDYATDLAIYTKSEENEFKFADSVRKILAVKYKVLPHLYSKQELDNILHKVNWHNGSVLAILTLDAHLDEITTIMDAVTFVTWIIQVLFMLILMVGILNTYRVLVFERTKEIGTLRAMGMTRREVRFMFLSEAFFLDLAATVGGFILFIFFSRIISVINVAGLPGSGLFTVQSHLIPRINSSMALLTAFLMLIAVLVSASGPAGSASRLSPVEAFRVDN